jgi:hypothetical protein
MRKKNKNPVQEFIDVFCEELAKEIQTNAKRNLDTPRPPFNQPTTFTGRLRDSIKVKKQGKVWIIEAEAPYAEEVEFGSFPHHVPIKPLKEWAKQKLGDEGAAYAVQKKIAEKGTRAQPFMDPAMFQSFSEAFDKAKKKVFG